MRAEADIRADIYSLGCTLYYLLTGGPPFQGTSLYDILQAHHSMDAKPLNLASPEVPVELAALVAKMMAKEPERRFQEPKEVAQALAPFFKKGDVAFKSPGVELSQADQPGSGRPVPGLVPTPTIAEAPDAARIAHPHEERRGAVGTCDGVEELDRSGGNGESPRKTPAVKPSRRPPWILPSVAVGTLLLGILIALGQFILFNTSKGTIELANIPKGHYRPHRQRANRRHLARQRKTPGDLGRARSSRGTGAEGRIHCIR